MISISPSLFMSFAAIDHCATFFNVKSVPESNEDILIVERVEVFLCTRTLKVDLPSLATSGFPSKLKSATAIYTSSSYQVYALEIEGMETLESKIEADTSKELISLSVTLNANVLSSIAPLEVTEIGESVACAGTKTVNWVLVAEVTDALIPPK